MSNKVFKQRTIPQNWSLKKVSEIAKTGSGGTPLSTCKEYYDGGNIPWINSGEVGQNSIKQTSNFITKAGMENSSAKLFPAGSILLALYGATAGKTSFLEINATTNQAICAIMPKKGYDAKFIKYYLDALYSYLVGVSTGSARDNLNQNGIQDLEIPFPSETIQQSIAKVLSDLDAKIELNNRINRELEAMAKTLYDYWFVQFDFPVRTLSGVEGYKSSGGKMVYNVELKREIPEGWEVGNIGDYCPSTGGFAFKSSWWTNEGVSVVKIKDIQEDYTIDISNLAKVDLTDKKIDNKFKAKPGDILIAMTGATVGKYGIVPITDYPIYVNQRVGYFNLGNEPTEKLPYLINSLNQSYFREMIFSLASGAAQPNISNEQINKISLVIPDKTIVNNYNLKFAPFYKSILNNQRQNQQLTALRDWLLPMLMNGQVTVRQAHGKLETEERLNMAAEPSVEYKKG